MEGAEGSELELAIETIVNYYDKYSGRKYFVCGKEVIKKSSLKNMLRKELNHMLTYTKNEEAMKIMIQELDQDGDGMIDFNEYWDLIGNIVKSFARNKQ